MTHDTDNHPVLIPPAPANPLAPDTLATQSAYKIAAPMNEQITPALLRDALQDSLDHDPCNADTLHYHTQLLNLMFHRFLDKGLGQARWGGEKVPESINTEYMSLALRAQRQCRVTIAELKRGKDDEA